MEIVKAPFTKEQIEIMNYNQNHGHFHPFTCCGPGDIPECERNAHISEGLLIAIEEGWICPCGKYKQNWAYTNQTKIQEDPFNRIKRMIKIENLK